MPDVKSAMIKRIFAILIILFLVFLFDCFPYSQIYKEPVTASAASSPDLIIDRVTWSPETPVIGDEVTFTVTISNQGTADSGNFYVAYYIDDDYIGEDFFQSIDVGASVSRTFTWTAEPGRHTIKAVADYRNHIDESNESNNEKSYTLSVLAPDLIISSITWSPEEPSIGETATFIVTIKNLGLATSGSCRVYFYIDGASRGYQDVPKIAAGDTVTKNFSWFVKAGDHHIEAIVDKDNSVRESDETNNSKEAIFSTPLPDLIIEDITWSPTEPSIGDNVSFTVVVKNQGSANASASFVYFYVDDKLLDSDSINEIGVNATANVTFSWIVLEGTHTIKADVSTYTIVQESDETNNEMAITFSPLLSDLIIQDITLSLIHI